MKFLEGVILIQTYPDPDCPKKPDDFSLEDIPLTLKIARRRKLEEEANHVMDLLIKFHGSPHVSSVNLMTCMGSLALIAKMRPQFMPNVIQGIFLYTLYICYFLVHFCIKFNNYNVIIYVIINYNVMHSFTEIAT